MLHLALLRSPLPHARIVNIDTSAAEQLPGVVAVRHRRGARRPRPGVDADAVRRHASRARHRQGAVPGPGGRRRRRREPVRRVGRASSSSTSSTTRSRPSSTRSQALAADAPLIRDDKEGQTDNPCYEWEAGDKAATDQAFAAGRQGREPRHALPALAPRAARDVRLRRRPRPGHRPGDHLHDVAGAARHPHAVRDGCRACPRRTSG